MTALRRAAAALLRAVRRLGSAVAEVNRQQKRLSIIHSSLDSYLPHPDAPPATYSEFLVRTQGSLLHEPSARARLAGRAVR
jgi:hypothetical protein